MNALQAIRVLVLQHILLHLIACQLFDMPCNIGGSNEASDVGCGFRQLAKHRGDISNERFVLL